MIGLQWGANKSHNHGVCRILATALVSYLKVPELSFVCWFSNCLMSNYSIDNRGTTLDMFTCTQEIRSLEEIRLCRKCVFLHALLLPRDLETSCRANCWATVTGAKCTVASQEHANDMPQAAIVFIISLLVPFTPSILFSGLYIMSFNSQKSHILKGGLLKTLRKHVSQTCFGPLGQNHPFLKSHNFFWMSVACMNVP